VGSNRELPVNVRIIAATNKRLREEVRLGRFREDLFYRLNVISLQIPALRERPGDIPLLANHFMQLLAGELGVETRRLDDAELSRLLSYDWPGNVRELKNVIERSLLLNKNPSTCLAGVTGDLPAAPSADESAESLRLDTVEKQHILKVLDQASGNKSAAARILGISRKTLERKSQAWRLDQ
jgi:DNA-binding NtrC family response regulator